jgi:polyhydroxyalkanoate synthesis regulator phasin
MIRCLQLMLLATLLLLFSASSSASDLPPGDGKAIVERTCVSCHALKVVTAKRASKEQWSTLVDQMISRGADLSDDEAGIVVDYLAKNFGPAKEPDGGEKNHSQSGSMSMNQISSNQSASSGPNRNQIKNISLKEWRNLSKVLGIESSEAAF